MVKSDASNLHDFVKLSPAATVPGATIAGPSHINPHKWDYSRPTCARRLSKNGEDVQEQPLYYVGCKPRQPTLQSCHLVQAVPDQIPPAQNFANLHRRVHSRQRGLQSRRGRSSTCKAGRTHLEDAVRLHGVHTHLCELAAARDAAPIRGACRTGPQRRVRVLDCRERGGGLQALGDVYLF